MVAEVVHGFNQLLHGGLHRGYFLGPHDVVGTSFFVAQNIMIAFTLFFVMERQSVPKQWQTSMTVAAMVTFVAAWNYGFMKGTWVGLQESPTAYRYTDWLITVPLLIIEFYLVLRATTRCGEGVFWRLLWASLIMLLGGYMGETGIIDCVSGFVIGMAGYIYINVEVFSGECAELNENSHNKAGQRAFNTLRLLLSVGWLIYPLGYLCLIFGRGEAATMGVNVLYNLADLVNKGFFGLACYAAAKDDYKEGLLKLQKDAANLGVA